MTITNGATRRATSPTAWATAAMLTATLLVSTGAICLAQSSANERTQEKAFEVASVKLNKTDDSQNYCNITMDAGDENDPLTGGLFTATNFPLNVYLAFAYKVPPNQTQSLLAELPKWASADKFDIQARAAGNATKGEIRLMMQSLLADRFNLAVHWETRQLPILALALAKSGNTGGRLRPHVDNPPCASPSTPLLESTPGNTGVHFPLVCDKFVGEFVSGHWRVSGRNMTIERIASIFSVVGLFDRPIVDQTGLQGSFDFSMEFTPEFNGPVGFQPDPSGPTFLEALKDQLGLKLSSQTGPVDVLVIDHVEQPSPN